MEIRAGNPQCKSVLGRNLRWKSTIGRNLRRESVMKIRAGNDFLMEIRAGKDFSSLWVRILGFLPSLRVSCSQHVKNGKELRERRLEGEDRAFLLAHYMCV